jgi:hypothetical protein
MPADNGDSDMVNSFQTYGITWERYKDGIIDGLILHNE